MSVVMIEIDWSITDGYIHAFAHLLSVLIILLLVVWYRPQRNKDQSEIDRLTARLKKVIETLRLAAKFKGE